MRHTPHFFVLSAIAALAIGFSSMAHSQSQATPAQASKPPVASAAETKTGMGMEMGMGGAHGSGHMHKIMMKGMEGMTMIEPTGSVDMDFAVMMKMHHEQALEMAKAEIEHGKSAELKAMSRKIITAQKKEILELDKWIAANK